ncbi:MAG: hypothetical protein COB78_09090 [Hyphomicrobiales bacterium]|nr:MAG: hypothetical protein COB78_09090 [Hyphomicrobiales bacterium]
MSEVKAQKKNSTEPKKAKTVKTEAGAKGASETTKSADTTSVAKTAAAPKSASQSSISHFSSVSTPAYKEGWANIFGRSKIDHTTASNTDDGEHFPEKLTIHDVDIDKELRSALYKAFQRQARAQGIDLAKINKQVEFEYVLDCNIKKK